MKPANKIGAKLRAAAAKELAEQYSREIWFEEANPNSQGITVFIRDPKMRSALPEIFRGYPVRVIDTWESDTAAMDQWRSGDYY